MNELIADNNTSSHDVTRSMPKQLLDDHKWTYLRKRYSMTSREMQVAKLICCGLGNNHIATELEIKHATVKTHIRNLYRKLWVHSKISMLLKFIEDINATTAPTPEIQEYPSFETEESNEQTLTVNN